MVNNKGGANLEERWMASETSTGALLSAVLSKDCGKGKKVSVREREARGGGREGGERGGREVSLLRC